VRLQYYVAEDKQQTQAVLDLFHSLAGPRQDGMLCSNSNANHNCKSATSSKQLQQASEQHHHHHMVAAQSSHALIRILGSMGSIDDQLPSASSLHRLVTVFGALDKVAEASVQQFMEATSCSKEQAERLVRFWDCVGCEPMCQAMN
jgi:hypothetical protein